MVSLMSNQRMTVLTMCTDDYLRESVQSDLGGSVVKGRKSILRKSDINCYRIQDDKTVSESWTSVDAVIRI